MNLRLFHFSNYARKESQSRPKMMWGSFCRISFFSNLLLDHTFLRTPPPTTVVIYMTTSFSKPIIPKSKPNQKLPNNQKKKPFIQMLKLLICGSHLHLEDQEDEQQPMNSSAGSSPCSTPRRSRKPGFYKRHNNNKDKNPYANRGLDKFSALLADVEKKRQKIYNETGSEDISLVRFVYKNSDDLVPIVVKLKGSNNNNKKDRKTKRSSSAINYEGAKENIKQATNNSDISLDKFPIESSVAESTEVKKEPKPKPESYYKKMTKIRSFSCTLDLWKRPPYYLPAVVIMILLLLTVFGRSVAILCTSISWYVVPTLTESSGRTKLSTKKKDYVKKLSDRRIVTEGQVTSPRISHPGGSKDKPSAKHGHQKSW